MPKTSRENIGARLRFEVLRRCNFACYYCGVPAAMGVKQLHIDHVIPVAMGGTNAPWNLVAACWDCNAGKTNSTPPEHLIREVRESYLADVAHQEEWDLCAYCQAPFEVDEERGGGEYCPSCEDRDIAIWRLGWDSGYARAGGIH